jgi:trans-aconitate 2-methyltransferase
VPDPWDPRQYERFKAERLAPGLDLIALVEPSRHPLRVVDLGCGTGELTLALHQRLPGAETLGIDRSEKMLAEADRHAAGGVRFQLAEIEQYLAALPAGSLDVIFSNAALQWVPGHASLFGRLTELLAPGGQLAIQLPAMEHDIAHRAAVIAAGEEPFKTALQGFVHHLEALEPRKYAEMFFRFGYTRQIVRTQLYPHVLPSRESIVEWMRGTLLTAYETILPAELFPAFIDRYRSTLFDAVTDERPFFFPYRRLLIWGSRSW